MEKVYQETSEKTGSKSHVWAYLAATIVGAAAGLGACVLVADFTGMALVAAIAGVVAAGVVGGGLLMLVCHLAGAWDDEVVPYFDMEKKEVSADGTAVRVANLKTNRGLVKFVLFNFITFGIYGIVVMSEVGEDINTVAGRYDGRKTMHFCLLYFLVSWLTMQIGTIVWYHRLSARIGRELKRRNIHYRFGAGSFWGWNLLGLFIAIGPFIYMHKLFKAMNLLCKDYNLHY